MIGYLYLLYRYGAINKKGSKNTAFFINTLSMAMEDSVRKGIGL